MLADIDQQWVNTIMDLGKFAVVLFLILVISVLASFISNLDSSPTVYTPAPPKRRGKKRR